MKLVNNMLIQVNTVRGEALVLGSMAGLDRRPSTTWCG